MPHFNSLRSFANDDANTSEEQQSHKKQMIPPTFLLQPDADILHTDAFPVFSMATDTDDLVLTQSRVHSGTGAFPSAQTGPGPHAVIPGTPLHDIQSTQSLILALQGTMRSKPAKAPLVIPGARKRLRNTAAPSVQGRRLHPRLRSIIVLGVTGVVLLFTLFSLTPLGNGRSGVPFFDGAVQWAQAQQNWNLSARAVPTQSPAMPHAAAVTTHPMTLPTSQYIAIARQDAINAGIPPDAFVRQINQESSFNPNAVSPAGAVGIAQFLPSTAAGLGINPYDPVSALNGAARYMANLANQYGGDYAKGLAAYNAGPGNVQRAINLGGANWLAYMPAETQNYVRIIMG